MREQLRNEIIKEMEPLYNSKLAKSEALWKWKRDERTKEVESYWKGKLGKLVSKDKIELEQEIETLKKIFKKSPRVFNPADEGEKRQAEPTGFNNLSVYPEPKPSQDRPNLDFPMKEKNKGFAEGGTAGESWFEDTRRNSADMYSKLLEKDQELHRLQAQEQNSLLQQPLLADNTDALIESGQELQGTFGSQAQKLVNLQQESKEQERRQMLIDELEKKGGELNDAEKRISELEQRLAVSSMPLSSQISTSPLSISSTSKASPFSAYLSPSIAPVPSATGSNPLLNKSRFVTPRSFFILILIFLLGFFIPFLRSLATSGSEHKLVALTSHNDGLCWEAWEAADRERNEAALTYEESWRRMQEAGRMGD